MEEVWDLQEWTSMHSEQHCLGEHVNAKNYYLYIIYYTLHTYIATNNILNSQTKF